MGGRNKGPYPVAKTLLTLDDQEGGDGNGLEESEHEAGMALVYSSLCVLQKFQGVGFYRFYTILC